MILIENPFPLFSDNNGELLESGYIYIGTAGLNPETNPINVFWDKDLLYPAAQPIRTINGLPARNGTPTPLYTASVEYSLMTKDKNLVFISSTSYYPTPVVPADDSITVAMYTTAAYPVLLVDSQTAAGDKTWTGKTANKAVTPTYELEETGAAANNKIWQLVASAEQFIFRLANDAKDAFASVFTVDRTDNTVDTVNVLSTNLQHNSTKVLIQTDLLDEDDMVSDSDTEGATQQSIKAYADAIAGQNTWSSSNGVQTGTNIIPYDDTLPGSAEGNEYLTVTITPKKIGNTILLDCILLVSPSVSAQVAACLFIDSSPVASETSFKTIGGGENNLLTLMYRYPVVSLSAVTFKIRAGMHTAGTLTVNGNAGVSYYGFSSASHIRVLETSNA